MIFDDILKAIIAPAVVATIVALIGGIISNKMKNKNDIKIIRYTKLHWLLENWDKFSIYKDSNREQEEKEFDLQSQSVDRYLQCRNCYDLAKPLLDDKFINKLDKFFEEGNERLAQIYLKQTQHEELRKILIVYEEKSIDFEEEKFWNLLEEMIGELLKDKKYQPMQNVNDIKTTLHEIKVQHDELRNEFTIFASGSSCLEESITKQLKELEK